MYVQTYTLALPRQHTDRVRLPSAPYSNSFSGRTSLSLSYVEFSSEFCKESTRIMHHHTFYQAIPVLRTFRRGCEPSAQANLQVSRRLSVWVCLWFPALWKWPPLSLSSPRCPTRTITHFRFSSSFFPEFGANSEKTKLFRIRAEFGANSTTGWRTRGKLRNPDNPDQILESGAAQNIRRHYRKIYRRWLSWRPACLARPHPR